MSQTCAKWIKAAYPKADFRQLLSYEFKIYADSRNRYESAVGGGTAASSDYIDFSINALLHIKK